MCDHPPVALCREINGRVNETVLYDPTDDWCTYYDPGVNCFAGDNRFRDMASCEAACSGPQRMPACSAPVYMHTCSPGIDTKSSAYYHFEDWCLAVEKGSCLVGQGFSSEQDCKDACKEENTGPAECHNTNVVVCNLAAHIHQVAFFQGHCEQRANICPKSVGFTSIKHCSRMCESAFKTSPVPSLQRQ
ncbi:uncharacterized protein LOC125947278 [Dermacentor silvarum]|uniref:uncharacterized protein LOC125947278 n=1 Tax=Dermacentor silvarum TaxID=543639 RepID=UPI002101C263|nr:uncharacterized protein LOC125947278 [Dermacentor silvarum]